MHALAAGSQGQSLGAWAYLAVLAATAAGYEQATLALGRRRNAAIGG